MDIMKDECLKFLRNVSDYQYTGDEFEVLVAFKKECETRTRRMEASMQTETRLVQWVSELDTAKQTFNRKAGYCTYGRDRSVMPGKKNEMLAYIDTQITSCKAKVADMLKFIQKHQVKEASMVQNSVCPTATLRDMRACLDAL